MDKVKGQAGFTLMELAVVLTIIVVLAAVAAPRFADVGEQAGDAAVHVTAAAARAAFAGFVALRGVRPTCGQVFEGMVGINHTLDPAQRVVYGPGGVATTITCVSAMAGGVPRAVSVGIWSNRSFHRNHQTALWVVF